MRCHDTGTHSATLCIDYKLQAEAPMTATIKKNILWFRDISMGDVAMVGGKNASLGEMVRELGEKGIKVPMASQ